MDSPNSSQVKLILGLYPVYILIGLIYMTFTFKFKIVILQRDGLKIYTGFHKYYFKWEDITDFSVKMPYLKRDVGDSINQKETMPFYSKSTFFQIKIQTSILEKNMGKIHLSLDYFNQFLQFVYRLQIFSCNRENLIAKKRNKPNFILWQFYHQMNKFQSLNNLLIKDTKGQEIVYEKPSVHKKITISIMLLTSLVFITVGVLNPYLSNSNRMNSIFIFAGFFVLSIISVLCDPKFWKKKKIDYEN